ncbi:MAG: glycoside hydrolase family 57 protein [Bacillota bacterium]
MAPSGYLCLVLHAHLPFVRHVEYEDSLEERWLFQAITESYLPLLHRLRRLVREGVRFSLTVSLSPPLLEMLDDDLLRKRYKRHLSIMHDLASREMARLKGSPRRPIAEMYKERFEKAYDMYTRELGEDLPSAWKHLQESGCVELMTSSATHAYLPLLIQEESVAAQVETGVRAFERRFGMRPKGFWLPECAYTPEIEPHLADAGIKYFILETHGILCGTPRPRYGFYAPVLTPFGLSAFGRDVDCGKQVWSADEGYPGDGVYREFHRDIAYELPLEYLGKAVPGGIRTPTGIKYYRVTDRRSEHKELYDPDIASQRAKTHAENFVFWRKKEAEYWGSVLGKPPLMTAPYDAELFGHWWYEGPEWIEEVLRLTAGPCGTVRSVTPGTYLEEHPPGDIVKPAASSWGYKGYSEVWLGPENGWIYRHLHACQEAMAEASRAYAGAGGTVRRALNQAFRELLLAQASDWPFILTSGTVPDYARKRLLNHIGRFRTLISQVNSGEIDETYLREVEERDNIFAFLDFESFSKKGESLSAVPSLP